MDGQKLHHWMYIFFIFVFLLWWQDNTLRWSRTELLLFSFGRLLKMSIWGCHMKTDFWRLQSGKSLATDLWCSASSPCTKHFYWFAISFTSRPTQKSTAIYSVEIDPLPLQPAAACTYKHPAAHLHAAPYGPVFYMVTHYITYQEWINYKEYVNWNELPSGHLHGEP